MTRHISLDCESLGLDNNATLLSIGACAFDPYTGEIQDSFYEVIDLNQHLGGTIDASTVSWWMKQSQHARDAVFGDDVEKLRLDHALVKLSEWLGFTEQLPHGEYPDVKIWTRGSKDQAWLDSAYKGVGLQQPYQYWQFSDQRTLCDLFPEYMPVRMGGTSHNAADDAHYQALCLVHAFQRLYSTGTLLPPAR